MFKELLSILKGGNPLGEMGQNFALMLQMTYDMTRLAGEIYFGNLHGSENRTRLYEQDVKVNQLERVIRKQVVAHLALPGNTSDVPYCLILMSLVKDVERLGDYAKNVSEIIDLRPEPLPDDEIVKELREIRRGVEESFQSAAEIFASSDRERAVHFIRQGRDLAHRCEALLLKISRSDYNAGTTTATILGARYYKRIGGHVLNVLTSVVMPMHKIDYYDEDEIRAEDVEPA